MVCMQYKLSKDGFTLQSFLPSNFLSITRFIFQPYSKPCIWFLAKWNISVHLLGKWYRQNLISQTGSAALECSYNFCLILFLCQMYKYNEQYMFMSDVLYCKCNEDACGSWGNWWYRHSKKACEYESDFNCISARLQ